MSTFDHFWESSRSLMYQHSQLLTLLLAAQFIALALWLWRSQDRKQLMITLTLAAIAMATLLFATLLSAWSLKSVGRAVENVSLFSLGLVNIRLFGLGLFRLLLPLCRVHLLRIFEDLAELAGYCAWLMLYLHDAGLDLSSLITTSAVMTAVLAFSMQDTLGNILGGLALQLDNSIKVGDWIKVDDVNGRVADIRWRYTAIETRNWETVIIPNSLLMKGKFSVLGRRADQPLQWRRWIHFEVGYDHFPGRVIEIAQTAIRHGQIANVASSPAANCVLLEFSPSAAHYALRYWLTQIENDDATDSAVRSRLYAALQRAGIQLPYPRYHVHLTNKDAQHEQNKQLRRLKERIDALQQVELFNTLHEQELAEIAEQLVYTPFAQGDVIMRQGSIAHWLYIVITGVADVFLELPEGGRRQVNSIHGGCFLGEMGLMTGEPRSATVIASSEVLAYRLDKASFERVLSNRPEIAVEISKLLAERKFDLDNLQQRLNDESDLQRAKHQQNLLERIRLFFRLSVE